MDRLSERTITRGGKCLCCIWRPYYSI